MDVLSQQRRAETIVQAYSNFKKDSASRKTEDNLKKRLQTLEDIWTAFAETDKTLSQDLHSSYVETDYAAKTFALYTEYKDKLTTLLHQIEREKNRHSSSSKETIQTPKQALQDNNMSTLEKLQRQFRLKKANIQQQIDSTLENSANATPAYFTHKIKQLEQLWSEISEIDNGLMAEEYPATQQDEMETLRNTYDAAMIKLSELNNTKKSEIKVPIIKIPTFSGEYQKWKAFHDIFEQTIHKNTRLSGVEKLQHLKTSVNGQAAQIIQHLMITEENYEPAWDLLEKRYNNKRRIVSTYLNTLLHQNKIQYATADQLKKIHDTTRECIYGIQSMEIDTNHCDFLLTHIILEKLDDETKRLFEQAIIDPKEVQKFDHLMKFIEERFNALDATETGTKQPRFFNNNKTTKLTYSARENANDQQKCSKCNDNHLLYKCTDFKALEPKDRLNFVKKEKRCANCLKSKPSMERMLK